MGACAALQRQQMCAHLRACVRVSQVVQVCICACVHVWVGAWVRGCGCAVSSGAVLHTHPPSLLYCSAASTLLAMTSISTGLPSLSRVPACHTRKHVVAVWCCSALLQYVGVSGVCVRFSQCSRWIHRHRQTEIRTHAHGHGHARTGDSSNTVTTCA